MRFGVFANNPQIILMPSKIPLEEKLM